VFEEKVRDRIHNVSVKKQKTRFKNFGNIGYRYRLSVHGWLMYQYRPQKSHVDQYLILNTNFQTSSDFFEIHTQVNYRHYNINAFADGA